MRSLTPPIAAEAHRIWGPMAGTRRCSTRTPTGVAIARAIASWDVDASKGALFDGSRQLSALTGPAHNIAVDRDRGGARRGLEGLKRVFY